MRRRTRNRWFVFYKDISHEYLEGKYPKLDLSKKITLYGFDLVEGRIGKWKSYAGIGVNILIHTYDNAVYGRWAICLYFGRFEVSLSQKLGLRGCTYYASGLGPE